MPLPLPTTAAYHCAIEGGDSVKRLQVASESRKSQFWSPTSARQYEPENRGRGGAKTFANYLCTSEHPHTKFGLVKKNIRVRYAEYDNMIGFELLLNFSMCRGIFSFLLLH